MKTKFKWMIGLAFNKKGFIEKCSRSKECNTCSTLNVVRNKKCCVCGDRIN